MTESLFTQGTFYKTVGGWTVEVLHVENHIVVKHHLPHGLTLVLHHNLDGTHKDPKREKHALTETVVLEKHKQQEAPQVFKEPQLTPAQQTRFELAPKNQQDLEAELANAKMIISEQEKTIQKLQSQIAEFLVDSGDVPDENNHPIED